jgi:hypothetical protein
LKNALDLANLRNSQGLIFLAQYSPAFHSEYARTGPDVPVTRERDQLYALASYYLVAGERSYFGYGNPPYLDNGFLLFEAINFDIGNPIGDYFIFSSQGGQGENILNNSNFEATDDNNNPAKWIAAEPVEVDYDIRYEGKSSVRIDSITDSNNNNNKQSVTLKPHTTYTLSGYVKTLNISGPYQFSGANFYPYDFSDSFPKITGCMRSLKDTNDWTFLYCTFTTGNDVEGDIYFRIQFGTGTAWFDKIELREGIPRIVLGRKYSKALVLVRPRAEEKSDYQDRVKYKTRNIYHQISAGGSIDKPSNSVTLRSGEAAILSCMYRGNKYFEGAVCKKSAPAPPIKISPANNQKDMDTIVTFKWRQSFYPDEDDLKYTLSLCTNKDFKNCSVLTVASSSDQKLNYAGIRSFGEIIFLGIIGISSLGSKRKLNLLIIVVTLTCTILSSCGGGDSRGVIANNVDNLIGNSDPPSEIHYNVSELSCTVSGLKNNTTYFWKVNTSNSENSTDSTTWNFTTR